MFEKCRICHRPFHGFFQLLLHVFNTSYIAPVDVRGLDEYLAKRRWRHLAKGIIEIIPCYCHLIENLSRDALHIKVNLRKYPPDRTHGSFTSQSGKISSYETMGEVGKFFKFHDISKYLLESYVARREGDTSAVPEFNSGIDL